MHVVKSLCLTSCLPPFQSEAEQRERASAEACMQRLPEGVEAVQSQNGAECAVCGDEDDFETNLMLQCDRCLMHCHQSCYGVSHRPNGRLWLCDVCQLGMILSMFDSEHPNASPMNQALLPGISLAVPRWSPPCRRRLKHSLERLTTPRSGQPQIPIFSCNIAMTY